MSRLERDQSKPEDPPVDATRDAPAFTEPISDADNSVAHIAELVRRTTQRHAEQRPAPVADPDMTVAHPPPMPAPRIAPPADATQTAPPGDATQISRPADFTQIAPSADATQISRPDPMPIPRHVAPQTAPPGEEAPRPARWQPSRRMLVTAGVLVVLLIGGGVALTNPFGADPKPPATATRAASAPDGYAVQVTDVITDCAGHSRGKTKASFEQDNCVKATRWLATGEVGGRPVLFVVSRIEMSSSDAAASVKKVLDGNGTGNLNDLLRDGKTYDGAPQEMPSSGYASVQVGDVVAVAEAGFVDDGRSSSTDLSLRSAAAKVATRVSAQS